MIRKSVLAAICALIFSAAWSTAQAPIIRNPGNPPLFQRFAAPTSGPIRFLLSDRGLSLLRRSKTPVAIAVLKALGEPLPAASDYPVAIAPESLFSQPQVMLDPEAAEQPAIGSQPLFAQQPQAPVANGCGSDGTVFNLEPAVNAAPQAGESVDFIYNGVAAGADLVVSTANDFRGGLLRTFYYSHRTPSGCLPAFEGPLPDLIGLSGESDSSIGGGVVAADQARGAFFIADEHLGSNATGGTTAIGLFRTTKANLLSTATCPSGTHTSAQAAACWPARTLVNPLPAPLTQFQQEFPSLAVDQRASGTGAGDVYVTGSEFDLQSDTSRTWLVACKNNLSLCSAPVFITGSDSDTALSDVRVRPDGGITVTYVSLPPILSSVFKLWFTSCKPAGAPFTPACSPPVLVQTENNPLEIVFTEPILAVTFPKHTHRVDAGITQTFVVWHRCKVATGFICPDSDILMKYSINGGATWLGPINVDVSNDDQFVPSITTDANTQTVNIAYLNNHIDPTFQHLFVLDLTQILPGATTPTAATILTGTADDASNGPFSLGLNADIGFGSLGVSARGSGAAGASRVYTGYTYNLRAGIYNGIPGPQPDNYLTRATY